MAKQAVPNVGSKLKVSTPVPDMLYGYNSIGAFPQQEAQLRSIDVLGALYPASILLNASTAN